MRTMKDPPRWFSGPTLAIALLVSYLGPREALATNLCDCDLSPTAIQIDVWLDPGHDPTHKGNKGLNQNARLNEEDVTWEVTNDLRNVLLNSGYCALLTRINFNTVYSPRQRACIASGRKMNDSGDRAFGQAMVSIHTNSGPPATYGTLTVYPSVKSCAPQAGQFLDDQSFAVDLQAAMSPQMALAYTGACSGGLPCNMNKGTCASGAACAPGMKSAIEEARIPAVIVEVGYQTNACQECAMRIQPGVIANAVAAGIFNTFITPTFCGSPKRPSTGGGSAALARSRVPEAVVADAPRRIGSKPTPTQVLSFSEGFEGGTFPPNGWTIQTTGAPAAFAWARTTSTYYVGSGTAAGFIGGGYSSAKDEWLISPAIALGAGDTGLRFSWVGNRVFASEVDIQVLARPTGGGSWTTLWSLSSEPYGNSFAKKSKVVSLGAFSGQTIDIALRAVGTSGADFSVDDVAVGAFQVSQPPGNDLCASAAQLPGGSFNLSGATCTAANNMDPSDGTASACIGYEMDGSDVFYHFDVGVGDTLTASVHGLWGPALYVMKACSGLPADCVAGAYLEDSDLDPTVEVVFSQAGEYFLVVDAPAGSCGDFQLSGTLHGPTVGVGSEVPKDLGLLIAPNPMNARASITGEFRRAADGQVKLTITDIQGRRVLQRDLRVTRGHVRWDWNRLGSDGKRVPAGIYVIDLRHGGETLRSRVIVQD
jgi:N-acetylmuramoyl-L-alanine amidase